MLCKKTQGKLYTFCGFKWQREEEGGGGGGTDSIVQSLHLSGNSFKSKRKKKKPADPCPQG